MKKHFISTLLTIVAFCCTAQANNTVWREINTTQVPAKGERKITPTTYKVFALNDEYMKGILFQVSEQPKNGTLISLPMPDGRMQNFSIWQTPVMTPELAAKFPGIKNFTAIAVDAPGVTAKINYTYNGFNAMVYDGRNTYFVDPYTTSNEGFYICYYKKDYPNTAQHDFSCGVADKLEEELQQPGKMIINTEPPVVGFKANGDTKKTFRMALTCTGEYAVAVNGPTPQKPNVISAMATTLARVNGVLEREIAVTFQLVNNNDQLVYIDPATDPFTTIQNNNVGGGTQTANQTNTDNVIGTGNYDIGHIFCSGNGGIADLAGLCDLGHEARGATGNANPVGDAFDIDFVIHEIGHQLGAEHTFNYNSGKCNPHASQTCAYEPGSGSTIMGYAGLCTGNDMQLNSDDYFHSRSLEQMTDYISTTLPLLCGTTSSSGNNPPSVADIAVTYNIPHNTPFELEAPLANDTDNDVINYCWEQYDLGDFGKGLDDTKQGPIFRSFKPVASRWRIFPMLDTLRFGDYSYRSEKLPEVTRDLNFRLVVRDMFNGWGSYNWSDNTVTLKATDQSGPFRVQAPNWHSDYWRNGNSYTVTWNVANTTSAPVSAGNVDIFLSLDDGITWPITLATNTPNDGNETITVPAGSYTGAARVKVKGSGNVFFDMSDNGFVINDWPDSINDIENLSRVEIYPVPAKDVVHVKLIDGGAYDAKMTNSIGQIVWTEEIEQNVSINVSNLSSGVYYFNLVSKYSGKNIVKKIVVQ